MKFIDLNAVYTLWLREMKRFFRARSRIVGSIIQPLFFILILGTGFRKVGGFSGLPDGTDYLSFLVPGIIAMTILYSSMFAGLSVLWDRQFGFLKEIMVAPVPRSSLVLGRIAGGMTTAIIQASLILVISFFFGFRIAEPINLLPAFFVMLLIGISFVGLGVAISSRMEDMHGFQAIMQFIIMPIFFLSGAIFPLEALPGWLAKISYIDPLTYGVDALRGILIGSYFFSLTLDLTVLIAFSIMMVAIGTCLFNRCEV